jgi:hypothetical protein
MRENAAKIADLVGLICGLIFFGFWMNIVGNPHVVETVIGLVIAGAVWFVVRRTFKNFGS